MNNLIAQSKSLTMTSVDISDLTGKRHSDITRDIRNIQDQLNERSFAVMSGYIDASNRKRDMWIMDKDEVMLLLTGYSVELRMRVIKRLSELESKKQFQIPQTLGEALQLAADQAKQLELQAPKVAFVDNCVERGGLMNVTTVAQKHKMSAVKLNKFLDELGGVYSKSIKRSRVFVQSFVDGGYGELKQTSAGFSQPLFTAKGEQWINEKLLIEGVI